MAATFSVPARCAALLAAALDQRLGDMDIAAANERAGALRSAELVGGKAHEVGAEVADPAIDAAGALHRVDVQHAVGGVDDVGNFADRLDHAGFVIGEHHRNKRTLAPAMALLRA